MQMSVGWGCGGPWNNNEKRGGGGERGGRGETDLSNNTKEQLADARGIVVLTVPAVLTCRAYSI